MNSGDGGDHRGDLSSFKEVLEALYQMILRRPPPSPLPKRCRRDGDESGDKKAAEEKVEEEDDKDIEGVLTLGGIDFVLPQILHIYSLLLPVTLTPDVSIFANPGRAGSGTATAAAATAAAGSTNANSSSSGGRRSSLASGRFGGGNSTGDNSSSSGSGGGLFLSGAVENVIRLELLRDFVLAVCEKSMPVALKVSF